MGDSEIAELCSKIYSQHKQALDLIYEHNLNSGSENVEFVKELVKRAKPYGLELDYRQKNLIRFAVTEWDSLPFQKTCTRWTRSNRILLFEFKNESPDISLYLTVGPGELSIKQAIYDALQFLDIVGVAETRPAKGEGWHFLVKQPIVDLAEIGDSTKELTDEIEGFWNRFLVRDLPLIKQAIVNQFRARE